MYARAGADPRYGADPYHAAQAPPTRAPGVGRWSGEGAPRSESDVGSNASGRQGPPQGAAQSAMPEKGGMDTHFPQYSSAEAASHGVIDINGQQVQIWSYRQLEFLDKQGLRQRAMRLQDVIGAERLPPIPSMQRDDSIRWILHVQSQITGGDIRFEFGAPRYMVREEARRPLGEIAMPPQQEPFPFGRRNIPTKDHLEVLFDGSLKTPEDMIFRGEGIETLRPGGEGMRHIFAEDHMMNEGIADVGEQGIETLRLGGEGRRSIQPEDHFVNEGTVNVGEEGIETMRPGGEGRRHIQPLDHMITEGTADIDPGHHLVTDRNVDIHVTGDRKRHIPTPDHMINVGLASVQNERNEAEAGHGHGRKHVTYGTGPRFSSNGFQQHYHSVWKRDPSRLCGNSMMC